MGKPEEAVSCEREDNRGRLAWLSVGTVCEKMYSREVEIVCVPRDHPLRASPDAHRRKISLSRFLTISSVFEEISYRIELILRFSDSLALLCKGIIINALHQRNIGVV